MRPKLLIFDSHPVQYKAPVYQCLAVLRPHSFKVIYATDCSVRGYTDKDFASRVAWDTPLLEGYDYQVLNNEHGTPLSGFKSLTGRSIFSLLRREHPQAVLISQFLYQSDLVAYLSCVALHIPVWIRHETQDEAFPRPRRKAQLRWLAYRLIYSFVSHAFYIGTLSREHLLRHGFSERQLSFAPYCVSTPISAMAEMEKSALRRKVREQHGVAENETLLLFSGKLIEKKNPGLLLEALKAMATAQRARSKVVFVGSGGLENDLRKKAADYPGQVIFTGFVNQREMPGYYLAADVLVLPSRRMGETWGLVVNEALHAGCGVVMTDAVGCHREFGSWERVRVIKDGDAAACAKAISGLAAIPRSFNWCARQMESYSVEAAAAAIAAKLDLLSPVP